MLEAKVPPAAWLKAYRFLMPSLMPCVIIRSAVRISRYFAIRTMEWKNPVKPFVAFWMFPINWPPKYLGMAANPYRLKAPPTF